MQQKSVFECFSDRIYDEEFLSSWNFNGMMSDVDRAQTAITLALFFQS